MTMPSMMMTAMTIHWVKNKIMLRTRAKTTTMKVTKQPKTETINSMACVIYLSPNDDSRVLLESLRKKLRKELYPGYDAFSPSSPVSPCPEKLPLKKARASSGPSASQFRPLLPVARFSSVDAAVNVAKVLQRTWGPLTFNVNDVRFPSRDDDSDWGSTPGVAACPPTTRTMPPTRGGWR